MLKCSRAFHPTWRRDARTTAHAEQPADQSIMAALRRPTARPTHGRRPSPSTAATPATNSWTRTSSRAVMTMWTLLFGGCCLTQCWIGTEAAISNRGKCFWICFKLLANTHTHRSSVRETMARHKWMRKYASHSQPDWTRHMCIIIVIAMGSWQRRLLCWCFLRPIVAGCLQATGDKSTNWRSVVPWVQWIQSEQLAYWPYTVRLGHSHCLGFCC